MEKTNWNELKIEYITTQITYKALAAKYNVPFETVRGHARKEGWGEERRKHNANVTRRACNLAAEKKSRKLARLITSADNLVRMADKAIKNAKSIYDNGCTSTEQIDKFAHTVELLAKTVRNVNDISTEREERLYELELKRLELEGRKAALEDSGNGSGEIRVVFEGDGDLSK